MTLNNTPYVEGPRPVIIEDDSDEVPIDITKEVEDEDKHLVQPAGVGAAVVGTIFFGPILGALIGFSSAYAVRKKNGAGNVARAFGELSHSVQQKTAEIEEKHHFGERTVAAINDVFDDPNEKSILFKTREFFVSTWLALANFTKEKQLLEKGVEGTGQGIEAIGRACERLGGKSPKPTEDKVYVAKEAPVEITKGEFQYAELVPVTTN